MLTLVPTNKYPDGYIKKIMDEGYDGKIASKPVIVSLSCHPEIKVEIKEPKDQILVCPNCFKRNLLTWSKRSGGHKIAYEK